MICSGVGTPEGDEDRGDDKDGPGTTGGGKGLCARIAAACAWKVVETTGQPLPIPSRFCSVTTAAPMRSSCDCVELSWGKDMRTDGFSRTCPAATFCFSFCGQGENVMR